MRLNWFETTKGDFMKKMILSTLVTLVTVSCFAEGTVFTCDEQSIGKIREGDESTIANFANAVAEFQVANIEFSKRIDKQKLLRELFDDISSLKKRNNKFLPKTNSADESAKETRELITSLEMEQNRKDAIALQKIYVHLAPCESAYMGD